MEPRLTRIIPIHGVLSNHTSGLRLPLGGFARFDDELACLKGQDFSIFQPALQAKQVLAVALDKKSGTFHGTALR